MQRQRLAPGGESTVRRFVGHMGSELDLIGTLPVDVVCRPWAQRFLRSFLGFRRHLGIITALRAAWIVVNA